MQQKNPLAIYCSACGAPAEFNIVKQSYHCGYCGQDTAVARALDRHRSRRQEEMQRVQYEAAQSREEIASCPNCGAEVFLPQGEALGSCDYCGARVVRRSYAEASEQVYPEVIIPFYITRDEAVEIVREWIKKHPFNSMAKHFRGREEELTASYLPYDVLRGPVSCDVRRRDITRPYNCGGFLDTVAVNASRQLNNLVLDAAEPFDWEEARPFSFAYLAGHKAKLPDVSPKRMSSRINDEIRESYMPTLARTMQTKEIQAVINKDDVFRMPALLPMFFIKDGPNELAVNGQTGRVAVTDGLVKKSKPWIIEPTLLTIAVTALTYFLTRMPELTIGLGLLAAVLSFIIMGEGRGEVSSEKFLQGKPVKALRKGSELQLKRVRDKDKKDPEAEPVFFEPVRGEERKVRVVFYEPWRMISGLLMSLTVVMLPYALAIIFLVIKGLIKGDMSYVENAFWGGGAAWLCVTVPVGFAYFLNFGRKLIYNHPIFFEATERGRGRKLRSDRDPEIGLTDEIVQVLSIPLLIVGLLAFALISFVVIIVA